MQLQWAIKTALKDGKKQSRKLFLFASSIVLGIASFTAIEGFRATVANAINTEAKELLGADLVARTNSYSTDSIVELLQPYSETVSVEKSMASMLFVPKSEGSRLVNVRAMQPGYPVYGEIECTPSGSTQKIFNQQVALVDPTLMQQFNLQIGDSIRVGAIYFEVAGAIDNIPGQVGITATVAPSVLIGYNYLNTTELVQQGSRVFSYVYTKLLPTANPDTLAKQFEAQKNLATVRFETIESRKERLGKVYENLNNYLLLITFTALILGGLGVAASVRLYLQQQQQKVALFKCLGIGKNAILLFYSTQLFVASLVASILGVALGAIIQFFLPQVLSDFLPFTVEFQLSSEGLIAGLFSGVLLTLAITFGSLLATSKITPLALLNESILPKAKLFDASVFVGLGAFSFALLFLFTQSLYLSLGFTIGILVLYGLLFLVSFLLIKGMQPVIVSMRNFSIKMGLLNLVRKPAQSSLTISSISFGLVILFLLYLVQGSLLNQLKVGSESNQPNFIVFDVRKNQEADLLQFFEQQEMPVLQNVPVVAMRLHSLKNQLNYEWKNDTTHTIPTHVFDREYRATYRDHIIESEKIIEGTFEPNYSGNGLVPVSVEERYFNQMQAQIGDSISFNVQGVILNGYIASVREVDFTRIQTNFTVLFPTNVLEKAPQFKVFISRTTNTEQAAKVQQDLLVDFPNVSVVNLDFILKTVTELFAKIGFAIRFMALFSVIGGFIVLINLMAINRFTQRENGALLRTLGAIQPQLNTLFLTEYLVLAILAVVVALIISISVAAASITAVFSISLFVPILELLALSLLLIGAIALLGFINTRPILRQSPLLVLRNN